MADQHALPIRQRPPGPVRAATVILIVVAGLMVVLFLAELISGVDEADPGGQRGTTEANQLILGLIGFWVARLLSLGRRGGLILAVVAGLWFMCTGFSLSDLSLPFSVLSVVPVAAGLALLVLLLAPASSRDWFSPTKWASTR